MAVIEALAGIKPDATTKIQTLAGAIECRTKGLPPTISNWSFRRSARWPARGTISPANALDFKMTAKVSGQSIPFLVTGTMADPSFRPDVKAVVTQKAEGAVEGAVQSQERLRGGAACAA